MTAHRLYCHPFYIKLLTVLIQESFKRLQIKYIIKENFCFFKSLLNNNTKAD